MNERWTGLLPIRTSAGKSRLDADLTEVFARDTLDAVLGCELVERVYVVGREFPDLEICQINDPGSGLNDAIAHALEQIALEQIALEQIALEQIALEEIGRPVVVILGDLPALIARELAAVLRAAEQVDAGFVMDHRGTGTTMITMHGSVPLHFGPHSAEAFANAGLTPLPAGERARCDVDTPEDLVRARGLGVGTHTARWLEEIDIKEMGPSHQATTPPLGTA